MYPPTPPPVRSICKTLAPATAITEVAGMVKTRVLFQEIPLRVAMVIPLNWTLRSCVENPGIDPLTHEPPLARSMVMRSREDGDAWAAVSGKWMRLRGSEEVTARSKLMMSSLSASTPMGLAYSPAR